MMAAIAALGCAAIEPAAEPPTTGLVVATAPAPSSDERYCAWYGAPGSDDVLYFGQAAFWSAMADAGGDPTADLRRAGPQLVGRFDLADERLLAPLEVGGPGSRSGVWDVLVAGDGEIYFTTFFERAGSVDPRTGRARQLDLGGALNELAIGPDGTLLATRYGSGSSDSADGSVLAFDPDGRRLKHWPLAAPPGFRVAPKTPLWDALRGELWVTTDLLPISGEPGAPIRHDAYAVASDGSVRRIAEPPELMFIAADRDGTVYRAEIAARELSIQVVPPPGAGPPRRVALDAAFAVGVDFVQDIQPAGDGRVVVTRWSGRVHVLHPDGRVRSVSLPRLDPSGLYYTAVVRGDRLCATYCAGVTVVCVDAP
jgi:sugar lactone lactonase YvrE